MSSRASSPRTLALAAAVAVTLVGATEPDADARELATHTDDPAAAPVAPQPDRSQVHRPPPTDGKLDPRNGYRRARPRTARIATVGGATLFGVAHRMLAVGFHQDAGAGLPLAAVEPTRRERLRHPGHVVMPSRGRGTHRASAVDVAVDHAAVVRAPVTGTVVAVEDYALYGRTPDVLVHVVPDDDPGLLVRVHHVEDPVVAEGDRVVAGRTPLARRARLLPFPSQVDRISGARAPHVHISVAPAPAAG